MIGYMVRILPGLVVGILFLVLLPRSGTAFRLTAYILLFLLIRDAMTPIGFWSFGSDGFFWLRFHLSPLMLILFGAVSFGIVLLMNAVEPDLRGLPTWFRGAPAIDVLWGVGGAVVVALPLYVVYLFVPIAERGGEVAPVLLPALLVMTLLGNLYEEVLFRGYFQGYVERVDGVTPPRAAILSGVLFAFGHIFLALTVTDVGAPLLVFTLYEGVLAGFVNMKWGLVAATITHGGAVFLLAAGII